jgi:trigger factor
VLHFEGDRYSIAIGTVNFQDCGNDFTPISLDGHPIFNFRIEDDQLLVSFVLLDLDGKPLLRIVDNELVLSTSNWDVEFLGSALTIRNGSGDIALALSFYPPSHVSVARLKMSTQIASIEITPRLELVFAYKGETRTLKEWSIVRISGFLVGIAVGPPPPGTRALASAFR